MSVMERRLQLLLDMPRYERVAQAAEREGRSLSAVIREAIDIAYPDISVTRQAAARRFLELAEQATAHADSPGIPEVPFDSNAELTEWSDSLP